jgi:mercuric transport protein
MRKNRIAALIAFALVLALASLTASAASKTVTIKVEGMHCGNCSASVAKALKATDGVEEVTVSFEKGEAWVKYDDQKVSLSKLQEVINSTGYKAIGEKTADGKSE